MNEPLFLLHICMVMGFGVMALKMGRGALTAWIALQAVLANLFVIKQICFFNLHVTGSDVFAIGTVFGLNLLREYFGKEAAAKGLQACFFAMAFFVLMAQIHLFYQPSPYDTTHAAFSTILSPSWRLLFASVAAFFIVQQIELRLFGYLKLKFRSIPLVARNAVSTVSTQFLDTLLFTLLGLWGLVANLSDVILMSFLIKVAVIALMTPLILFSKRFIGAHDAA